MSSRTWRRGALVAACMAAAAALYVFKFSAKMPDFEVYWRAGLRAAAGEPLYRAGDGHYQFKYLPAFAVLVAPLTTVPIDGARVLWYALSLSSLVGLVAVSLRFWPVDERRCWLLVALTLAVMGKFYARELLLGQANAMFAVACAGTALAFIRGRERLAGALLAVGVVLKPYGLLLVPWLLARRRRPSSIALGVGLLSAACVPLLEYSVAETMMLHAQWWSTVRDTTAPNLLSADNVSWLAMYTKWLGAGPWPLALWALTGVVAFTMMVWMWAQRTRVAGPEALELAALLLLIPLVSPQGWDYVLLLATPAVVCLLTFARHLPAALRVATFIALAIVGLTFYDVLGRNAYNALMMASGITLSTFVLLSALFVLRLRHAA